MTASTRSQRTTALRRVGVLGTIAVTGVPTAQEARSDQLAELVIYLALQRHFVAGLTLGANKG